ncbi:hypothetical protein AAZX31_07G186900 [Glycine max]
MFKTTTLSHSPICNNSLMIAATAFKLSGTGTGTGTGETFFC